LKTDVGKKNKPIIIIYSKLEYKAYIIFTEINLYNEVKILYINNNDKISTTLKIVRTGFYFHTEYILLFESRQFKRRKSFDTARDIES